jgi:16S rRNA (cytosine967-C5)-methyltransferase
VNRWLTREGFEATASWCDFNNRPPEPTVRWRRPTDASLLDALVAAGIDARQARFVRHAARLAPGALGRLPDDLRAAVSVQDEGSQLVAYAVGARPGDRVLDVCAAPGGKSVVIAGTLGDGGLLVAGDHRPARLTLLRQTLEAVGPSAVLLGLDARRALPFSAVFDRVLLDAPCSGLGTLARDPDVKWRRSEADLAGFAASQRIMLAQAAQVVRPGGLLVYATCSAEPEENDEVVDAFLADHPDFSNTPVDFPASVDRARELLTARGRLATSPPRHGLDAFFAAALARRPAP